MTRFDGPEDLSEQELLQALSHRRQMLLDQDDTDWQELDTLLMHCERAVLNAQEERAERWSLPWGRRLRRWPI